MSTAAPLTAAGAPPREGGRGRGRTTIAPRALDRTAAAVAAEVFGVAAQSVQVRLSDRGGLLALHVRTPISALSLERVRRTPEAIGPGGTLRERAAAGQTVIQERVTTLTGALVGHVTVELTGVEAQQQKRVE